MALKKKRPALLIVAFLLFPFLLNVALAADDWAVSSDWTWSKTEWQIGILPASGTTTTSTLFKGEACTFTCAWVAPNGLSYGLMGSNITGSWANRTASALSGATDTFTDAFTLPADSGRVVGIRYYANDSLGQWGDSGILTLTTSERGSIVGPVGSGSTEIRFKVLLDEKPVDGCEIQLFETPHNIYELTVYTGADGWASVFIRFGEYTYIARYGEYEFAGDILHIQYEEVTIRLDQGQASVDRPSIKTAVAFIILAVCLVCGAGFAFSQIKRMT